MAATYSLTSGGPANGAVPTSSDDLILDALSGNFTVVSTLSCNAFTCTGYAAILDMQAQLRVSGNVTLAPTMTITGTAALVSDNTTSTATRSWTSNGKTWGRPVQFGAINSSFTTTIADAWSVTDLSSATSNTLTINTGTITVTGNVGLAATIAGTATVLMTGVTQSINTGSVIFGCNLTISNTGTIDLTLFQKFGDAVVPTFTYNSGTVTYPTTMTWQTGMTYNAASLTWGSVVFSGNGGTFTLSSNMIAVNADVTSSAFANTINGNNLNLTGNLTNSAGGGLGTNGTTVINMTGTGIWSGSGRLGMPLTINASGTITLSGSIAFGAASNPSFIYSAGTIVTTGSTLTLSLSCSLNVSGIAFESIAFSGVTTVTMSANVNCINLTNGAGIATINGAFNWNVSGNLTATTNSITGTATIVLNGTGTWTNILGTYINCNLTIDTTGTITCGATVGQSSTFTYVKGIVDTTTNNSTLVNNGGGTYNLFGILWNNFRAQQGTLTFSSVFEFKGSLILDNNQVWNGSAVNCYGTVNQNTGFNVSGTTVFRFSGNNPSWIGTMLIRLDVEIACSGKMIMSGTLNKDQKNFTYTCGIVDATAATLAIGNITAADVFTNIHKITFGGGVTFINASLTMNRFFNSQGQYPCQIRPVTTGSLAITLTTPSTSEFVYVNSVNVSSTGYQLRISTRDADKGSNTGNILFMSNQTCQGLVDEDDYRNSAGYQGFVNHWGQTPQGLVRNS